MLRTRDEVPGLRQRRVYAAMLRVLAGYLGRPDFRIVHISIQRDHIHLIVEAADELALSRCMRSFTINAARAINAACKRSGKVFRFRYHAKQITTRRYAHNVLIYVLNNWRKHGEAGRGVGSRAALDGYSSARSFAGWSKRARSVSEHFDDPLPVSPPQTDLLAWEWEWFGKIDPFHVPGPDRS